MSYDSMSIKQAIHEIDHNKIYLPALQRKFVWGKHQIVLLFDSLMRGYPIGTFLFWKLQSRNAASFVFYEFLKEYDERSPYNRRKTGTFTHSEITGVLDGQQRLSSMYIGLMGTHTERGRYRRSNSDTAYEKMCLYLNLLTLPYKISDQGKLETHDQQNFEFKFLTPEVARWQTSRKKMVEENEESSSEGQESVYWFKVGDVLSWEADLDSDYQVDVISRDCSNEEQRSIIQHNRRVIKKCFEVLFKRICEDKLLNYFEIAKSDLEDILPIFVRVNSGGTVLSKTDLLFSTIVATWADGREKIEELLKSINGKGDKFNFGNEFLMRCCLMLTDAPIVYKVNSFKAENVAKIQTEWTRIAEAVRKTVDLLVEFGFNASLLTSQNAALIMAYYVYNSGDLGKASKDGLQKYLIHALLNGIYGSSQDQLLSALRNAFREKVCSEDGKICYKLKSNCFSFENLQSIRFPGKKTITVTEADIEQFLLSKKGPTSFFVLSLLYPQLRFQDQVFHQDHIHPFSKFNRENLLSLGIAEEEHAKWFELRDTVPNLQLLNGRLNESKNATDLIDWVMRMTEVDKRTFVQSNHFPENVGFEFSQFMIFYEARRDVLRSKLKAVLAVSSGAPVSQYEEREDEDEFEEFESQTDEVDMS